MTFYACLFQDSGAGGPTDDDEAHRTCVKRFVCSCYVTMKIFPPPPDILREQKNEYQSGSSKFKLTISGG